MYGLSKYEYLGDRTAWCVYSKEIEHHAPLTRAESTLTYLRRKGGGLAFDEWSETTYLVIPPEML